MSLTAGQLSTVNGLDRHGMHLEPGSEPCECDPAAIDTEAISQFSDGRVYRHRCRECGRRFETYTEG